MAEETAEKQPPRRRGRPFGAGASGNPAGRPAGSRNRATVALESLLEGEGEAITRACIEAAKGGDSVALRLCMERLFPLRRGRPVQFALPNLTGPADIVTALGGILSAIAVGDLTPDEGSQVANVFEAKRRAVETTELETRLAALEKAATP